MSKHAELWREKNDRQTVEEMERTSKSREDLLCELIEAHAKICYVCHFFCEHRTPEDRMEHGDFTGFCYYEDKDQERLEELGVVPDLMAFDLIVNDESTCSQFKSIFPGE